MSQVVNKFLVHPIADQTGQAGKFLTTNGTNTTWTSASPSGGVSNIAIVTSVTTVPYVSGVPIIFPIVTSDSSGSYSNITGQYTCASAGIYNVNINGFFSTSGGTIMSVYKNGSFYASINQAITSTISSGVVSIVCAATDILTIVPNNSDTLQYSAGVFGPGASFYRLGDI